MVEYLVSCVVDGFRKVAHVEVGGLKVERDDMEFAHACFIRGQEHLLENIKRKVAPPDFQPIRMSVTHKRDPAETSFRLQLQ